MRPRIIQMTATAALVLGLSMTPAPVLAQEAGDFEKGVAAFDAEKYRDALDLWLPLADEGNVDALRNVAQMYRLGLGVQRDDTTAFEYYEQAAERGSDDAQVNAAFQLLTGKGVEQDREAAATWFAKAADQGNPLAQYNLGLMYEKGVGVDKDMDFALELYRQAASQGQRRAIARLEALEASEEDARVASAEAAKAEEEKKKAEMAEAKAKAEAEAEAKAKADAAAEAEAKAKAEAEAEEKAEAARIAAEKAATEAEDDAENQQVAEATPLEFEALDEGANAPDKSAMPRYKSEADQNGSDARPVIDVVRTPMRKPGVKVADAPNGDEPTVISIPEPGQNDDEAMAAANSEDGSAEETAPRPVYTMRVEADHEKTAQKSTGAEADGEADDPAMAEKSDEATAATAMRAPSDPVARVRFAETAYREGRFDDAAAALMPLSNAGMPIAQFWMGRMYNRGEGVALNRAEAYSLWRAAAEGGSSRAATALANLAARLSPEEISVAEQRHAASGRAR